MRPLTRLLTLILMCVGPAHGADVEPVLAAPAAAPSFSGCHVGGHVGGLWTTAEDWVVRTPGGAFEGESLGGHDLGGTAGGTQVGCDYQLAGGFLFGVGTSHTWIEAEGSHPSARETGVTYSSETNGFTMIGARVGYAWGRLLGYIAGGAAWQHDEYAAATTRIGTAFTATERHLGWTVGAGAEYWLTPGVSAFASYHYADFGTNRIDLTPRVEGLRPAFVDITTHTSLVRVGLNIRFGPR